MTDVDQLEAMGPIDYLVVSFPGGRVTGEAMPLLVDLVDRNIIRILDLVVVAKDEDGSVRRLELSELEDGSFAVFEGASSGLLSQTEMDEAGAVLEPGSYAGLLVYENVWAGPFAAALRRAGGELVASGRIPVQELVRSLDAMEGS